MDKALSNLGLLYMKMGSFKQAFPMLERSIALNPNNSVAFLGLGRIHMENNEYEKALTLIQRAYELDSSNPLCLLSLAGMYMDMGEDMLVTKTLNKLTESTSRDRLIRLKTVFRELANPSAFILEQDKALFLIEGALHQDRIQPVRENKKREPNSPDRFPVKSDQ